MADSNFDQIIQKAADLERSVRRPLRKMKVSSGDQSVELEWDASDASTEADGAGPANGQAAASPGAGPGEQQTEESGDDHFHVCSPLVGTFYHSPEPGQPPFVTPGDLVEAGQQVGIVEAMKLMNPVEADQAGRVAEILVPDQTGVEYGQPLIALTPAGPDQQDDDSDQQEDHRD